VKSLPRLPSVSDDDAYRTDDDITPPTSAMGSIASIASSLTPMASRPILPSGSISGLPPPNVHAHGAKSLPITPERFSGVEDPTKGYFPTPGASDVASSASSIHSAAGSLPSSGDIPTPKPDHPLPLPPQSSAENREPAELLDNLRQTFHHTEQSLYSQLSRTPAQSLNEVRRAFLSSAKGTEKRLTAWQKKHISDGTKFGLPLPGLPVGGGEKKGKGKGRRGTKVKLECKQPKWFDKCCHIVPSGSIIVREDDWGSIIAFTLR
jgi:1-phosphatidylinositol-3-phosphate 5-kinase